ncbi:GCN5-related N-acetyltransferase [Minicystis rosea]|nr:GCN5-related N-acetyltransferase [Minicystis rosea]
MLLRAAAAADFEAIAEIVNHYIEHTAIHFSYEKETAAALSAAWEAQRTRYPMLVAEENGAVIGFSKAGPFRERAAYAWIVESGVYLRPDQGGRGLGEALMRPLVEVLREQGYHTIMAGIALPNEASVRLHERLGFVKVGHVAHAGWKFDRWHDVGFWQLALASSEAKAGEIRPPRHP